MMFQKMVINQLEKLFTLPYDICFHSFRKWRIETYYFAFAFSDLFISIFRFFYENTVF